MTRTCRICGGEFEAPTSRYHLCSDECRAESRRRTDARQKEKRDANPMRKAVNNARYRAKNPLKHCKVCGGKLAHNNQAMCLDCLLKEYKYGNEKTKHLQLLTNRGYDKECILAEIKRRRI